MLAHFSHHLLAALLTPLLPFIRDDFALDYTQVGWIVSAFLIAYGISQLPAGWLADRIGPRTLITIGISGVALSGLLVGLSPTYTMMIIFLVLLGIMGGGYHPASSPLVSASVEEKNRGRALGLHQIGGTASFFLTPLIAIAIATALGWRASFIVLAIPTIAFGIVFYLLLRRQGYTSQAEPEMPGNHAAAPSTVRRSRHLVPFITLGIAVQVLIFSALSFIPLFAVDHLGVSKGAVAVLLALFHSAGLWAGPLGGYFSDRIGKVPIMLAVGFIGGPALYLLNLVSSGWSISIVLVVMGMSQYISMPVSEAYIITHTSERNRSTILGIYYSASRGGPGAIIPFMGYLIGRIGFGNTFTIMATALLVITIGCSVLLWRNRD